MADDDPLTGPDQDGPDGDDQHAHSDSDASPHREQGGDEEAQESREDGLEDESQQEDTQSQEAAAAQPRSAVSAPQLNRTISGTLTLHYAERDIELPMDGDAALRALSIAERGRRPGLVDVLDPEGSTALSGWLIADFDTPLAVSWMPQLSAQRRTAIDPVPQR